MNKEKWLARARELGLEGAEIYEITSKDKEITWFDGHMDKYEISDTTSVGLRILKDGNMANAGLEKLDDQAMDEVFENLIQQADTITAEDKEKLVGPMQTQLTERTRTWKVPTTAQIKDTLKILDQKILDYDERIVQTAYLAWSQASGTRAIDNTLGLSTGDEDQVQYLAATAVASDGTALQDYTLIRLVPDLDTFDLDKFVKDLCSEAIDRLSATSIPTKTWKVILERRAMTALLAGFSGLFSGDAISKGLSPLKDKIGQKIFSDKITIIDDPRNTEALTLANFDDEGYPTRTKTVVDKGVFVTPLHNQKSAMRMGTESTGNGFKAGYASPVGVSPLNMYIQPGQKSLTQLMEEMGDGLVITELEGLHAGLDFTSTNFSLQARGYLAENGKRTKPVTLITAADTFMHLMNEVVAVGNDLEWEFQQVLSPSILFTGIAISGE